MPVLPDNFSKLTVPSDGLRLQRPLLTPHQVSDVLYGAHLAASAGKRQFDRMLGYLRSMNSESELA
jgi:hypothetical protein